MSLGVLEQKPRHKGVVPKDFFGRRGVLHVMRLPRQKLWQKGRDAGHKAFAGQGGMACHSTLGG